MTARHHPAPSPPSTADVTPLQVLSGGMDPPREMSPLYSTLNAALSGVERVTPPARVSASLERMTAGFDPDRCRATQACVEPPRTAGGLEG